MSRILHSADWHLISGRRFTDTHTVLDVLVGSGIAAGVNAWVIVGDISGREAPHVMTVEERLVLGQLFRRMADQAPVILVGGNHDDFDDITIFRLLGARHAIHVVTRPEIIRLHGVGTFYCMPYVTKKWALAGATPGISIAEQNATIMEQLGGIFDHWQADEAVGPRVLAVHGNVGGSIAATGQPMIGQEIDYDAARIEALGMDYVAFGHIHLAQGYYPGSPSCSDFGDADAKSWRIVTIERDVPAVIETVPSPCRRFVTLDATWCDNGAGDWSWAWSANPWEAGLRDVEVRLRLTVPEAQRTTADVASAEQLVRDAGAHHVEVKRATIVAERAREAAVRMEAAVSKADKVRVVLDAWGTDAATQAGALAKFEELQHAE